MLPLPPVCDDSVLVTDSADEVDDIVEIVECVDCVDCVAFVKVGVKAGN